MSNIFLALPVFILRIESLSGNLKCFECRSEWIPQRDEWKSDETQNI